MLVLLDNFFSSCLLSGSLCPYSYFAKKLFFETTFCTKKIKADSINKGKPHLKRVQLYKSRLVTGKVIQSIQS